MPTILCLMENLNAKKNKVLNHNRLLAKSRTTSGQPAHRPYITTDSVAKLNIQRIDSRLLMEFHVAQTTQHCCPTQLAN